MRPHNVKYKTSSDRGAPPLALYLSEAYILGACTAVPAAMLNKEEERGTKTENRTKKAKKLPKKLRP